MDIRLSTLIAPPSRRWLAPSMLLVTALSASCSMTEQPVVQSAGSESSEPEKLEGTQRVAHGQPQKKPFTFDLAAAQTLPKAPLGDLYRSLLARAEAGDLEAKRQLFLAMNECRVALEYHQPPAGDESVVDPKLLATTGMTREQFLADQQRRSLLSTDQTLKECEQLPAGAIEGAAKWLQQAAEGGDTYARLTYYNYLNLIVGDHQQQVESPELVEKFNRDSLRYIQSVADTGSPDGLFTLGTVYENGSIAPKDPIRAYAYKRAAGELTPIGGNAQVLDLMAKSLTPQELKQANQFANSLVQRSKR